MKMGQLIQPVSEAGDVIIRFDGKLLRKCVILPRIVAETDVDAMVDVVIIRNGEEVTLQVRLGELEQAENGGKLRKRQLMMCVRPFGDLWLCC